jgi:superfamily II DNA or RNA helicase
MTFKINEDGTKLILIESTKEEFNQLKYNLYPFVKDYRFMTRYKLGVWNGKIDFFNNGIINIGLWNNIYKLCQEYNYTFKIQNQEKFPIDTKITQEDIVKFCDEFYDGYKDKDNLEFKPYIHQIEAIYKLLKYRYGLVEVATAGGKSLILGTIIFYLLKKVNPDYKFLIIVPTISLVTQFYDDIIDYNIGYNKENKNPLKLEIQEIMSDKPRMVRDGQNPNIYIGTYQSLVKYPLSFFKQFNLVCCDESHLAKAETIKEILTKTFGSATYRVGLSGTYPVEGTCEMITIQSNIGPVLYTVKAKNLQDKGLISNIKIKSLILNYDDFEFASNIRAIINRGGGRRALELEKEYIHNSEKRKLFLTKLISKFKKNSLVLFHSIEYGTALYDFFRSNTQNIDFYYIDGSTPVERRNYIKAEMEKNGCEKVKILVASYGTTSTGINIKNINNIVFVDSFKSDQIIRQSIGRGLRLHKDKEKLFVFDIVDRFHIKLKNKLYEHYLERIKTIYDVQKFPFEELNIKI